MTDKRPEETNAADALLENPVGSVDFGGKHYDLKPMSAKQLIQLIQLIGGELAWVTMTVEQQQKLPPEQRSGAAELIAVFLDMLSEAKLVRLVAVLLNEDDEFVKANFSTVDALGVLDVVTDIEDFKQVFFRLSKIGNKVRAQMPKKAASASMSSSKQSSTSAQNTGTETSTSSKNPSGGSTAQSPSQGEESTQKA